MPSPLTEREKALVDTIALLIAAMIPFAAKHKQDKCFCQYCNNMRTTIGKAADIIAPLQAPEL